MQTTAGVTSIRNKRVNEIMHNPVGPWAESNRLYIEQSRLAEKLRVATTDELVVFDVGLGAAANALAALHCAAANPGSRPMKMISFEVDLELLKFALEHAREFDHFKGYEPALQKILDQGHWSDGRVQWELRHGDFVETIAAEKEKAHVVFYDPYSPQVNQDMWTRKNFANLRKCCREAAQGGAILSTYSRATPVRVALLCENFFVGAGVSIGMKKETTQASTILADLEAPLQARWVDRWKKSHTPWPLGSSSSEETEIRDKILHHPQFQT